MSSPRGEEPPRQPQVGESYPQGRPIPSGTWSRVSNAATADPRVSPAALRVLCALGRYADAAGKCYPAVASIAEIVGTNPRQVRIHLGRLERLEYLVRRRQRRAEGGGWSVNSYTLRFPPPPPVPKRTRGEREEPSGRIGPQSETRACGLPDANERNMSSDDRSAGNGEQNKPPTGEPSCRPSAGDMLSKSTCDLSPGDSRTSPSGTSPIGGEPSADNASPRDPRGRGAVAARPPDSNDTKVGVVVPIPSMSKQRARREAAARLHSVMVEHGGWARVSDDPALAAAYERALDAEAESTSAGVAELRRALLEAPSRLDGTLIRPNQQQGTDENDGR